MPDQQTSTQRGFWNLIGLQAQGAFNDNAIKMMLMLYAALLFSGEPAKQSIYNGIIGGMIPGAFLIFACWSGFIADKFSKRTVILATKVAELTIMLLSVLVFSLGSRLADPSYGIFLLALVVGFMLFVHSAFFSPSKYGIIPELVPEGRITWANGIVGLTTFVAIILGNVFTVSLFKQFEPDRLHYLPAILTGLSLAGLLLGLGIGRTPPANPMRSIDVNFFPELKRYIKILFSDRTLALTVLGLAYFWGLGTMLLTHVLVWGEYSLGLPKENAGYIFVILALGIGVGSAVAGMFSRDRIEVGLIPLGALGIAIFALPLTLANPGNKYLMMGLIFLVGGSAGFYSVPLNAILQSRTAKIDRGGLLAATAYFTDTAMVLSSGIYILLSGVMKLPPNMIFLIISLVTLVGTVVVLKLLPEALLRFVSFLLVRTVYRIRPIGRVNIPLEGPALLISNHVSFIDALLLSAVSPRPIRFIVWEGLYRKPLLRWFLRTMRCIPVSSEQKPRELLASLKKATEALKQGEVVCIFAEGEISRTGLMLPIQRGYEFILKGAPSPIIPVYLDGVWGSIFSFEGGKFFWKWPRQIPYHVRIALGRPLPPETQPFELQQAIEELSAEAALAAKPDLPLLDELLIGSARRNWGKFFMTDILSPPITFGQALWRSIILARRLASVWGDQEVVGVLLPPSVGGALVNYAVALSGRTVVNLNYTTGQAVLESCARRAGLRTVVTARAFLEKVNLQPPADPIYIEDYRGFHGFAEVFLAVLAARVFPIQWVERYCRAIRRPTSDTLATIIFSSGSTGEPKGVMLSNFNVASNVESFRHAIRILPEDRLLGTLPFFHSFGYTVSLWGGLAFPFASVFHLSPLDVKTIGELCQKHGVSIIVTTPTFLQTYLRRISPAQFGGINCVVTGAEKLSDRLRVAFLERFGVEPLQGYGTTECSPVVSVNVDDYRSPGFFQTGHKRGSIGHPLPGIAARIIHPETGQALAQGEAGLLLIKGANVMQGYLGMPEKTAEVIKDGWYNTGDVAYIDEDGFIFITDRLSRFSKIGGEMVPHIRVEEMLNEALGLSEPGLVVTATPDERKGEQLVVLHTLDEGLLDGVCEKLAKSGLPNLWIPRREMFFKIEAIPVLGSGKLDQQKVKELAARLAAEKATVGAGEE